MRAAMLALTGLSLAICVTTAVLWVRSYKRCDVLIPQRGPGDRLLCTSEFGLFVMEWESPQTGTIEPGWSYFTSPLPRRFRRSRAGFGVAIYHDLNTHYLLLPSTSVWGVSVPHGLVFVLAFVLPGVQLVRWRRRMIQRSRWRHGLCSACGYDLRAAAGRCPECGALGMLMPAGLACQTIPCHAGRGLDV
jgi:hypothetical protein